MKSRMVVLVGLMFACLICADISHAGEKLNFGVYGLIESWKWQENKGDFVDESGPIFAVGGQLGLGLLDPLWFEGNGNIWFGNVDYEGSIQTANGNIPHKSQTSYVGVNLDADLALKFPLGKELTVKPYAGTGANVWRRTLGFNPESNTIEDSGYEEIWAMWYGIIGVEGRYALSQRSSLFAKVQCNMPLVIYESADLSNVGGPSNVELEPGKKASYYLEGGMNISVVTASLFYQAISFPASDPDDSGRYSQPESDNKIFGVKAGLAF